MSSEATTQPVDLSEHPPSEAPSAWIKLQKTPQSLAILNDFKD